ncbi:hypothetical protein T03_8735 [Trichinella britovi]|uniref:Uncharacterized protein n=1 Tax=Trichinella britovi TaxID=45882 RepID=A0A0V1C959_TRIBR|nr:hypothetical protein T03_8735 [Trichinella britovi]
MPAQYALQGLLPRYRALCCVSECVEPLPAAFAGLSWLTRGHLPCSFLGYAGAHASDAGRGVTACLSLELYSRPVSQYHVAGPEVHAPHHGIQEICAQDARDHQLLYHHDRERPLPSPQVQLNNPPGEGRHLPSVAQLYWAGRSPQLPA